MLTSILALFKDRLECTGSKASTLPEHLQLVLKHLELITFFDFRMS